MRRTTSSAASAATADAVRASPYPAPGCWRFAMSTTGPSSPATAAEPIVPTLARPKKRPASAHGTTSAVDDHVDDVRLVEVASTDPPGCPVCGVFAVRVHSRRRQRLRDLPVAGPTKVVWVKRRWICDQPDARGDVQRGHRSGAGVPP